MTEPTTPADDTTAASNAPAEAPTEPADDSLELPQNLDQARKLRSENKTLRDRLKAAEEAASQTSAHLAAMRRTEVERLAADHLVDPTDMWTAHPDPAGFLGDDGTIDPARVAEAAQSITAAKPHLAAKRKTPPPPTDRPIESLRSGAAPDVKHTQPTWSDAIRVQR